MLESINKFGPCVINSTYSFLYPSAYLPQSLPEHKRLCKSQVDAIKCVKDKSKGSVAILRRGLLAYMNSRQRHHRKYCSNPETSEQARKFVEASKCAMEAKKFASFRATDSEFAQTLLEILRLNYNDSSAELKRMCCTFHTYKKVSFAQCKSAGCCALYLYQHSFYSTCKN